VVRCTPGAICDLVLDLRVNRTLSLRFVAPIVPRKSSYELIWILVSNMTSCDVAVIGAGPYGLSIAAYLNARGVDFRIFGSPMQTWLENMPRGMHLKSEGFASSLYDPGSTFTLSSYCKENGLPYADIGLPTPLDTFAAYGLEFQRRFVQQLEPQQVVSLRREAKTFVLELEKGERFSARKVVMAAGLSHFSYVPPSLSKLPKGFVSHSSTHRFLERFKGRAIAVVGAGASAADLALLLHRAGASVQLIARKPFIHFHDPPGQINPSLIQRLRTPITGIGPGWKLFLCTYAPLLFRQMPEKFRFEKVRKVLGPAPGWFVKEEVVGKVPINLGVNITEAGIHNGQAMLQLNDGAGNKRTVASDHVIAATGYKVDLRRLVFMDSGLLAEIRSVDHTPVLSSHFESSVPGLYFVGPAAANTFGPLLRFAYGARFASKRLSRHLAKSAVRNPIRRSAMRTAIHCQE
jgi:thioredoxin reductase